MQRVAAAEYARDACHQALVADRAFCFRVNFNRETFGKLVFRNKTYREDETVTFNKAFRTLNRAHFFINL